MRAKYSVPTFRVLHRLTVILSLRRIRDPSARGDEVRILRLRSQARFAQDDTALRERVRTFRIHYISLRWTRLARAWLSRPGRLCEISSRRARLGLLLRTTLQRLGQLLGGGAVAVERVAQVLRLVVGVDPLRRLGRCVTQDVLDLGQTGT